MATQADVRRIPLTLSETEEAKDRFAFKEFLLAADPAIFFTAPHDNGSPAVLVRLPAVRAPKLRALLTEAWRAQVPPGLDPTP